MTTRDIFTQNLNRYIEQSGKNKKIISEEMGIPYTTLVEWANGKKFPRADGIERLSNYFKILKSELLEEHTEYNSRLSIAKPVIPLSDHEKAVIEAYRAKPDMQAAIDTLLGIGDKKQERTIKIAAYGGGITEHRITANDEDIKKAIKASENDPFIMKSKK